MPAALPVHGEPLGEAPRRLSDDNWVVGGRGGDDKAGLTTALVPAPPPPPTPPPSAATEASTSMEEEEGAVAPPRPVRLSAAEAGVGCDHYWRFCEKQCKTCEQFFPCRFCHDAAITTHTFDRFATEVVRCRRCTLVQPFAAVCANVECQQPFGRYVCFACRLVDDAVNKQIYHCDKCGICRVGMREDYVHCDKCDVCISVRCSSHKCIPQSMRSNCPVCLEYMFDSRRPVVFLRCGHAMHHECLQELSHHDYRCPLCLKSVADMSAYYRTVDMHMQRTGRVEAVNGGHAGTISHILCNECERKCDAPFHYIYHKCTHCGSYNTSVISFRQADKHAPVEAAAVVDDAPNLLQNDAGQLPVLQAELLGHDDAAGPDQGLPALQQLPQPPPGLLHHLHPQPEQPQVLARQQQQILRLFREAAAALEVVAWRLLFVLFVVVGVYLLVAGPAAVTRPGPIAGAGAGAGELTCAAGGPLLLNVALPSCAAAAHQRP